MLKGHKIKSTDTYKRKWPHQSKQSQSDQLFRRINGNQWQSSLGPVA